MNFFRLSYHHRSLPFGFGFATLFSCVLPALSQTTSYSPIVGVVTTEVAANSDALVAPCLNRRPVGSATIDQVDNGVITVTGAPGWTADQFKGTHFIRVRGGIRSGFWGTITANGTNTLTIRPDGALSVGEGFAEGDVIDLIPHWTLGTLTAGSEIPNGMRAIIYNRNQSGINRSGQVYTYNLVNDEWRRGLTPANGTIIYPDESITLRNNSASAIVSFAQTGIVNEVGLAVILVSNTVGEAQDIRLSSVASIPITLGELFPADQSQLGEGDRIILVDNTAGIQNPSGSVYTYRAASGWRRGLSDANQVEIAPGEGMIYRRQVDNSHQAKVVIIEIPGQNN